MTQDDDFLKLHAAGVAHSGIAYSPRDSRSIGELVEMLLLPSATYDADGMVGRVEFI